MNATPAKFAPMTIALPNPGLDPVNWACLLIAVHVVSACVVYFLCKRSDKELF